MIETIVLNVLEENLSVPVELERPERKPGTYVVLEKTGSGRSNRLSHATFALQSFAPTLYEAAVLNEQVKEIMDQLPYLADCVFGSALNSDYNFTDTEAKQRRYQAVYNITYKE